MTEGGPELMSTYKIIKVEVDQAVVSLVVISIIIIVIDI